MNAFYGKYRGTVTNTVDPLHLGRIQVSVPTVFGDEAPGWAMPCTPYAGPQVGLFMVPPLGANVWVEFEAGDPAQPIWSGCFWGTGETPVVPAGAERSFLQTDAVTITLDDQPSDGGVTIEVRPPNVATPLRFVMNSSGIELSNGSSSVKLTPVSVSVNDGALEVV